MDLDRLAAQEYTPGVIVSISQSLAKLRQSLSVHTLDQDAAKEIIAQAHTGAVGIPKLIQIAMEEPKAGTNLAMEEGKADV